ncbi:MAG TPA: site-specific integrase [Pirellulales bacterium]|nr:site-specific integrase [Pirellulales bacterium]
MPRLVNATPKYRRHKPSGQAIVCIAGQPIYLGPHGSKESRREYDRLIGEWLAAGRPNAPAPKSDAELTVTELVAAYWRFAKSYYVKDGRPTGTAGIRVALRFLKRYYGHTAAAAFGPLGLKALQERMVQADQSRRYANDNVDHIRRCFKWAVAQELVPPAVFQGLATLPGLRKGRTAAREPEPVGPVTEAVVEATVPFLPAIVADMVRLQRLTGARPAEVCILRPCDVDRSAEVWTYRPASHKTQHHGRERVILIGPKAQAILLPYMLRDAETYCFAPNETEARRNAARREARQSPMTPSQASRRKKRKPARPAGNQYSAASYRRAIHRAADKADAKARTQDTTLPAEQRIVPRWSPNRLRHSAATELRSKYGLEAAQVILGHSQADVTQIYAERDLAKAATIMREVG